MGDKPLYDRAIFWVALGGVAVVVGGIFVAVGVAQVTPEKVPDYFGNAWFVAGLIAIGVGILLCLVALVLFFAHQHAENHLLRSNLETLASTSTVPQASSPMSAQTAAAPSPAPARPPVDQALQVDLQALANNWAKSTNAQQEYYFKTTLLGKWAVVEGPVGGSHLDPPSLVLEIDSEKIDFKSDRLNVILYFPSNLEAMIVLFDRGKHVRVIGRVMALERNFFQVPQIELSDCELL